MSNEEILMAYSDIAEDLAEREDWVRRGCISSDPVSILSRREDDEVCHKLRFVIKTLNRGFDKLTWSEKEVVAVRFLGKSRVVETANVLSKKCISTTNAIASALKKLEPECAAVASFVHEWRRKKEREEMQAMAQLVPPVVFDVPGPAG